MYEEMARAISLAHWLVKRAESLLIKTLYRSDTATKVRSTWWLIAFGWSAISTHKASITFLHDGFA